MKRKPLIIIVISLLLIIIIVATILSVQVESSRHVSYNYEEDVASVAKYEKVLRFAGGSDFSPFSYLDENGNPCGHDVELAFAIGRELECKVEITLGDWTDMQEGLLNGTYDVLMTVDYSEERSKIMGYTSPVCLDSYVYFGKDKNIDLSDLQSVKNLKIAALKNGGSTDNYLVPVGLLDNTSFYNTQVEAFESVVNGENDLAIAGYIYGSNIIANCGFDLVQVGTALYGSAYYFTYDIDEPSLGPAINSALASLEAKGETSRIENKWTEHYQPNLTVGEFIKDNVYILVIIGLSIIIIMVLLAEIIVGKSRLREKALLEKDQLTNLYNMRSFLLRVDNLVQKNKDKKYVFARFDINNFKSINSTQGSKVADELLSYIGNNLNFIKNDANGMILAGYLGADHFAILLEEGPFTLDPNKLYNFILDIVRAGYPSYLLSIKVGLVRIEDYYGDLTRYCDQSLLALRSIKNDVYQNYSWFDDQIQNKLNKEKQITDKMFNALNNNCFVPYFQPQFNYLTNEICGVEVLTRWFDDGEMISPGVFIPIFEKNGFIYELDKYIWNKSCQIFNEWKRKGYNIKHFSINISRAEIYRKDLVLTIKNIINANYLRPDEVHVEITESAYLDNSKLLLDVIKKLKSFGFMVEMDDFGSGYSSLSSLKDLDVDVLKIDMSLVQNNSLTGKDAAILSNVVKLGLDMGLEIISEGVETSEQAEYLSKLGCNIMQGYLFSKPISQEDFEKLIKNNN